VTGIDFSRQTALVVAPHPDDEVIGCGGLIRRIKDEGGRVYVQFVTVGDTRDASHGRCSTVAMRLSETAAVAAFLGFDDYEVALVGNEFHLHLDRLAQFELVGLFERDGRLSAGRVRPSMVLMPDLRSYNQDHRAIAQAVLTAVRPACGPLRHQPAAILMYEEVADHWGADAAPTPNLFVRLTDEQLSAKLMALSLYDSQCRAAPDPRSAEALRGLARFRGAQSAVGLAEAFRCLRWCV
jgi:LmbE family N-acetylglucosaminyl deacetylase